MCGIATMDGWSSRVRNERDDAHEEERERDGEMSGDHGGRSPLRPSARRVSIRAGRRTND